MGFSKVCFPSQTLQPALPRARWAGGHVRAHPSTGLPGGRGFEGPQSSRNSHEHLKHLPPRPSARLGAASPQGRWQSGAATLALGSPHPRAAGLGETQHSLQAPPHCRGCCQAGKQNAAGGHAAGCPLAPLSPVPHASSSVQATWPRLIMSVATGRREQGCGALISSFKANISLQGLCKPLVLTG